MPKDLANSARSGLSNENHSGMMPPRLIAASFPCGGNISYSVVFEQQAKGAYQIRLPTWDIANGASYSVDMVRLDFEISGSSEEFIKRLDTNMVLNVLETFTSNRIGTYRFMWCFDYADGREGGGVFERVGDDGETVTITDGNKGVVIKVGWGLVQKGGKQTNKGFIEFNPNKCEDNGRRLLRLMASWGCIFELKRWDLAIDYPINRRLVRVMKDRRKYEFIQTKGMTEYLGQRNNAGRVKVYDKSAEQEIDDAFITRVELTCNADWDATKILEMLPKCPDMREGAKLCKDSTTFALMCALADIADISSLDCAQGEKCCVLTPERYLSMLPKNTKYKVKKSLKSVNGLLKYDKSCIESEIMRAKSFEDDMIKNDMEGDFIDINTQKMKDIIKKLGV